MTEKNQKPGAYEVHASHQIKIWQYSFVWKKAKLWYRLGNNKYNTY